MNCGGDNYTNSQSESIENMDAILIEINTYVTIFIHESCPKRKIIKYDFWNNNYHIFHFYRYALKHLNIHLSIMLLFVSYILSNILKMILETKQRSWINLNI